MKSYPRLDNYPAAISAIMSARDSLLVEYLRHEVAPLLREDVIKKLHEAAGYLGFDLVERKTEPLEVASLAGDSSAGEEGYVAVSTSDIAAPSPPPAKDEFFDVGGLFFRCNPNGRFHGWLFYRHPDGQFVSLRQCPTVEPVYPPGLIPDDDDNRLGILGEEPGVI